MNELGPGEAGSETVWFVGWTRLTRSRAAPVKTAFGRTDQKVPLVV
jgi:hypothetical protein